MAIPSRDGRRCIREATMEFTVLFLAVVIVMLVAWFGSRSVALTLFAVTLLASIATYLHHATDTLKLSF
jgi:ABC-type proline/glycine betaine transport system permease subunit